MLVVDDDVSDVVIILRHQSTVRGLGAAAEAAAETASGGGISRSGDGNGLSKQ